jgi:hypothetical protein
MTLASPLAVDGRRKRSAAVWLGALLTSAFVGAGAAVAVSTLPAVPTPTNVVRAYVEAWFASDGPRAWGLLCSPSRSAMGDYTVFAENLASADEYNLFPSDVDVAVGDVHGARGTSLPSAAVAVTLTSDERSREDWEISGDLLIVEENGEFRVCGDGLGEG